MRASGVTILAALASVGGTALTHAPNPPRDPDLRLFLQAASREDREARAALDQIAASWKDGYAPLLLDLVRFMPNGPASAAAQETVPALDDGDPTGGAAPGVGRARLPDSPGRGSPPPAARIRGRLVRFLEKETRQQFGDDLRRWRHWYWQRPYDPHPDYAAFKARLYANVDPRMASFFPPGGKELVRLDEVDWGGVSVDGIPPLDHPPHVSARYARYLDDKNVVFGLALNGEARAYPKRVLAWHEMARDRLGGVEVAIVYCTLCGTVIPYGAEVGGVTRTFGTSGLLYRSNKLMYDAESMSLWSTVEGRPVLGVLAGEPLELRAYPVVTTTWREWREAHPDTTVLTLETGAKRDYGEGVAYRDYFASDALMFAVPQVDRRLPNKAEVLALMVEPVGGGTPRADAIAVSFLQKNRLHALEVAGRAIAIVTSTQGANRVYDTTGSSDRFVRLLGEARLETERGARYRVTEDALVAEAGDTSALPRVPARRAFWFGWYAQYPDTELIK